MPASTRSGVSKIAQFKELLLASGPAIVQSELAKISSLPISEDAVDRYIQALRDTPNAERVGSVAPAVVRGLVGAITHVPREKIFSDLAKMGQRVLASIQSSPKAKRFYIAISGDRDDNRQQHCLGKSNLFLATILLAQTPALIPMFEDFVCSAAPIHLRSDSAVRHIVYVDDATFTGEQVNENLGMMYHFIKKLGVPHADFTLHMVILYINPKTLINMDDMCDKKIAKRVAEWYTTETFPTPVSDRLHLSGMHKKLARSLLANEDILQEDGYHAKSIDKALFYTDLKIPDTFSIPSLFLLHPPIVDDVGGHGNFGESLVLGCSPPTDAEERWRLDRGNLCPVPTYKKEDWKGFVGEQLRRF